MSGYLTPQQQIAYDTVEKLIADGWKFKAYSYSPITKGWWTKDDGNPVHAMRRGDPKPFHEGAMVTAELYLSE